MLATVAGGGGFLALLAGGLLWLTRSAIATAVAQAGTREIERLKGDLAKELEKERQSFTRDFEREKQKAARELEAFKATLTLEAEVRRQVAARKVDALLRIVAAGEPLVAKVLGAAEPSVAATIQTLNGYFAEVRAALHFFDRETVEELLTYAGEVQRSEHEWRQNVDASAIKRATDAAERFLDVVRRELQVAISR